MSEGCQSGDVAAEQFAKGFGLGLTELGELPRRINHWAVVLAQLRAVASQWLHSGRKSVFGQALRHLVDGGDCRVTPSRGAEQPASPVDCEFSHSFAAVALGKKPQGLQGEGVVSLLACRSTGSGEGVDLAGATASGTWFGAVRRSIRSLN